MKRLIQAQESPFEHYVLPTKYLKQALKTHPQHSLQILKDRNFAVLNSGDKIFVFDLQKILLEGTGGLIEVVSH
jgi:hypothetical protein